MPGRGKNPDRDAEPGDLLKVDYSDQVGFRHQNLRDKFRVQAPIVIILALLVQCVVAIVILRGSQFPPFVVNSLGVSAIANLVSQLNYRQLRLFPGSRRLSYLLPAFAFPYIGTVVLLLWIRPPYSVPLLAIGFLTAITVSWIFGVVNRNPRSAPLLVVPSERTFEMLRELPGINHEVCAEPDRLAVAPSAVVVDLRHDLSPEWERALANAALSGSTIYNVKQVWESLSGRVRIDHLSENSFGTLMPNTLYFSLKNVADRVIGVIGLVVTLPIVLTAMIAIYLDDRNSPFFFQERIGFRGIPFTIVKLRTMKVPQPDLTTDLKEAAITKVGDTRITPIGRFLRHSRIDELPQFWNVIKGELSLIGPRPEASALSSWYDEKLDFYAYRHVVRPGITGWAQVNQGHVASDEGVYRKLQFDFYYIKNFSLWLDILITIKTIQVMIFRRGAK